MNWLIIYVNPKPTPDGGQTSIASRFACDEVPFADVERTLASGRGALVRVARPDDARLWEALEQAERHGAFTMLIIDDEDPAGPAFDRLLRSATPQDVRPIRVRPRA